MYPSPGVLNLISHFLEFKGAYDVVRHLQEGTGDFSTTPR